MQIYKTELNINIIIKNLFFGLLIGGIFVNKNYVLKKSDFD